MRASKQIDTLQMAAITRAGRAVVLRDTEDPFVVMLPTCRVDAAMNEAEAAEIALRSLPQLCGYTGTKTLVSAAITLSSGERCRCVVVTDAGLVAEVPGATTFSPVGFFTLAITRSILGWEAAEWAAGHLSPTN